MTDLFYEQPILNSPYEAPSRYWELDESGQPTHTILSGRRPASFKTPIVPSPHIETSAQRQSRLRFEDGSGVSTEDQEYDVNAYVNQVRRYVDQWRTLNDSQRWGVTPETARLLKHWREYEFEGIKPFFCQIEAVETVIWLTEVAPGYRDRGRETLQHLENANREANPALLRWALKMATGSGKTTVMAMIIAWQTVNAVRHPRSDKFTSGFLVVTPGITIKNRLRVLKPNDPESYYKDRQLVPSDMLRDLDKAIVVVTNYHALGLRETLSISKGGRKLLQGRSGTPLSTKETEGQMIRRVMPEMMAMKNIMVLNDEGHHCYREKQGDVEEGKLTAEDRREAKKNTDAARLWIRGIEMIQSRQGVSRVIDLSATPFFLRGSGYAEGTLFPWTVSDFSLMDAIECGIVKLPRVPVADNIAGGDMPKFRHLWSHIRDRMPRAGSSKSRVLDPLSIPLELQTALEALYGHYEKTHRLWQESDCPVPPCFIIVCNNTSTSRLVYEYVSGFERFDETGERRLENGRLPLFRNFDEDGNRLPRPPTLLIDSQQLESGEALDSEFRRAAAEEIELFRREIVERTGSREQADKISDQDILREVVNTVGKQGRLGERIRCVVSVAMLTEGWDAQNVTHILGVRALGTQLLCEQVVGRALRRQSYDLNEDGLFDVEYADVMGVPFDFNADPVASAPKPPRVVADVRAVIPERDHLEMTFPRVTGYRVELPREDISAEFNDESIMRLTPELIGPTITRNEGIIGEGVELSLIHTRNLRRAELEFNLAKHLVYNQWREAGESPNIHLFGALKRIVRRWLNECLVCVGDTYPAQLMYLELADMACEKITAAITRAKSDSRPVKAMLDPYVPNGSTSLVDFVTSKDTYRTDARKCHVNRVALDSGWEAEFCRVVESHPDVLAYVKNQNLGFEVPYRARMESKTYLPDFIIQLDDGLGSADPLNLIAEIKGYRYRDTDEKKMTMEDYWIPGVNNLGEYGRWAFAEFTDLFQMGDQLDAQIEGLVHERISACVTGNNPRALMKA